MGIGKLLSLENVLYVLQDAPVRQFIDYLQQWYNLILL